MVNAGVVLLIILVVLLTVGIITALTIAGIESGKSQGTGGTAGNIPACSQIVQLDRLQQIPDVGADCVQNGRTGQYFYIGNLGTGAYDYVVATFGTQPLDVCVNFCIGGSSGGVCSGPNYNGQSAQANFNRCMQQLSSDICSPPLPIAARGTTLYYAYSPTCKICSNCGQV